MNRTDAVLLEDIDHKLGAIMEGQEAMATMPGDVAQLKQDMIEVKDEIRLIKRVVKEHSGILEDHWRLHKSHSRNMTEIRHWLQDH